MKYWYISVYNGLFRFSLLKSKLDALETEFPMIYIGRLVRMRIHNTSPST